MTPLVFRDYDFHNSGRSQYATGIHSGLEVNFAISFHQTLLKLLQRERNPEALSRLRHNESYALGAVIVASERNAREKARKARYLLERRCHAFDPVVLRTIDQKLRALGNHTNLQSELAAAFQPNREREIRMH